MKMGSSQVEGHIERRHGAGGFKAHVGTCSTHHLPHTHGIMEMCCDLLLHVLLNKVGSCQGIDSWQNGSSKVQGHVGFWQRSSQLIAATTDHEGNVYGSERGGS